MCDEINEPCNNFFTKLWTFEIDICFSVKLILDGSFALLIQISKVWCKTFHIENNVIEKNRRQGKENSNPGFAITKRQFVFDYVFLYVNFSPKILLAKFLKAAVLSMNFVSCWLIWTHLSCTQHTVTTVAVLTNGKIGSPPVLPDDFFFE